MAIKTFTTGEVLTASDTNTYLANAGLTYLSTTSFSGSGTVQLTNAFNSTWRNYRAILSMTSNSGSNVYIRLLVGTTVQTGNILSLQWFSNISSGTLSVSSRGDQYSPAGAIFPTYTSTYVIDFFAPQAADYTNWNLDGVGGRSSTDSDHYHIVARNIATTQLDGFELTTAGAGNINGSMVLYGYRNA